MLFFVPELGLVSPLVHNLHGKFDYLVPMLKGYPKVSNFTYFGIFDILWQSSHLYFLIKINW